MRNRIKASHNNNKMCKIIINCQIYHFDHTQPISLPAEPNGNTCGQSTIVMVKNCNASWRLHLNGDKMKAFTDENDSLLDPRPASFSQYKFDQNFNCFSAENYISAFDAFDYIRSDTCSKLKSLRLAVIVDFIAIR